MHFVLQTPSLQHLAGVKIIASSWNQRAIMIQMTRTVIPPSYDGSPELMKGWKSIEERVKRNVSILALPEPCKQQLLKFIEPLGTQIHAWCGYHTGRCFHLLVKTLLPQQFCWTMRGTIDYAKTAELMLKDEKLGMERRYEMACINCLEEEARELILHISEERKQKYIDDVDAQYWSLEHRALIAYFTCAFSSDEDQLKRFILTKPIQGGSIEQYLFKAVLSIGNRAACEYFLKKLSQREKELVLVECQMGGFRHQLSPTCSLMYYVSLMNEEQRGRLLVTYVLLSDLLRWPLQSLFMETVTCGWEFLDEDERTLLMNDIVVRIRPGFRDYDYTRLFGECWRMIPTEHKQRYLDDMYYLENMFESKEEEFVRLILNDASSRQLLSLCNRFELDDPDESEISAAVFVECKEKASLISSNDPGDEEKRLRSQHLTRLVDIVTAERSTENRYFYVCPNFSKKKCTKFK